MALVVAATVASCATMGIRRVSPEECRAARLAALPPMYVPAPAAEDAYAAGNRAFARKQYDAAVRAYADALRLDSRYAAAYVARGNAELAARRYDRALDDYNRALAVDPRYADAHFARGTLYWLFGRLDAAESSYRQVIQLEPEDSFHYDRLARVLHDGERLQDVQALYEGAFRANPCREWALWGWLGAIAAREDFRSLARTAAGLRGLTTSAAVPYHAGLASLRDKDYRDARDAFEEALRIDSDHVPIETYSLLAESYRQLGDASGYKKNLVAYYERTGSDPPGLATSNIPSDLKQSLHEVLLDGGAVTAVAVAPTGGWVVTFDTNAFWRARLPDDLEQRLLTLNREGSRIRTVAFSPSGGWVVIYDGYGYAYRGIPAGLGKALQQLNRERAEIRNVAFTSGGGWVVVYGTNGYWRAGIPPALEDRLSALHEERHEIRSIAIDPDGGWVLVWGHNGYQVRGGSRIDATLEEWNEAKSSIDVVAVTAGGGWVAYSRDVAETLKARTPHRGH